MVAFINSSFSIITQTSINLSRNSSWDDLENFSPKDDIKLVHHVNNLFIDVISFLLSIGNSFIDKMLIGLTLGRSKQKLRR